MRKRTLVAVVSLAALGLLFFLALSDQPDVHPEAADVHQDGVGQAHGHHDGACSTCSHDQGVEEKERKAPVELRLEDIPESKLKTGLLSLKPEQLKDALSTLTQMNFQLNDVDSVRVDSSGGIYYVCAFTKPGGTDSGGGIIAAPESSETLGIPEIAGVSVPISSPPIRHSKPGAGKALFLDFNGHVITGTSWNTEDGVESWDCKAWSIDGDRTTFSAYEQSRIIQIWERVAEDYAPFDVDVTTEQPAVWSSQTGHALITPTTDKNGVACPHNGWGGIAYVNFFGKSNYSYDSTSAHSPAWCVDYTGANLAEVISHELGHNLGLSHDGDSASGYYPGHVNGSIKWGPIMGTGYDDDVSQWCKGEYYDANQTQDDLNIIKNLLGYRVDDHGNDNASASALIIVGAGDIADSGIIERTNDPDVFSFATGTGSITIEASAYKAASSTWGANLDVLLELYDAGGSLIATNNPALDVDASITKTVAAGVYYLHVKPTGVGDPFNSTPTGYTSYGSLGQYWLTGTISADVDNDTIPNQWEYDHFGSITGAVATADPDGDGANNLTEFVSGYDPNDSSSVFKVTDYTVPPSGNSPFVINWSPVAGRVYKVQWTYNLYAIPFSDISDDLPYPTGSYTDYEERTHLKNFYRVEVRLQD